MLTTYLRSSSVGGHKFCEMQGWLTYVLNLGPDEKNGWKRPRPGMKADKGNCTHKVMELLALRKVAEQEGRDEVVDEESGARFGTRDLTPRAAMDAAWAHYRKITPWWDWTQADYDDCWGWACDAMEFANGSFNPLLRDVLWPEKRFDIVMDHDWARYDYQLPGWPRMQGQLCLKGTVDLVCRVGGSDDVVEYVDWKTGQRKDWATGRKKDFAGLKEDFQLRLYHYALARLLPRAKEILVTIVFIRDGGPFSIPFSRSDLPRTERMIREAFEEMRDCVKPALAWDEPDGRFKCERLCVFHANQWEGSGKTVCEHFQDELLSLGMDRATARYADPNKVGRYGAGGGKSDSE